LIPACRNVFLPVFIGGLLLSLSVAPGCCRRGFGTGEKAVVADDTTGAGRVGVTVTKEVPHSKETIPEIKEREMTNPLPPRGDTAIHSHKILREGNDNCERTE
jgi:acetamidase/formamidase